MDTTPLHPNPPDRWHALDAVRALALLLGVLLHATLSYLPGAEYWYIVGDQRPSTALCMLFFLVHSFRMLTFFLIAGFFARLALLRWGEAHFIRDRLKRIALPLLIGWPLVLTSIIGVIVWSAWLKAGGTFPAETTPPPALTAEHFPLTHLWFLYLLLWLYAAALLFRGAGRLVDRDGRLARALDLLMQRGLHGLAPVLLALPIAVALPYTANWTPWFGIPTPDQSLYPNLGASLAFACAFAFGWWLQREARRWLTQIQAGRRRFLLLAAIGWAVSVGLLGLTPPAQTTLEPGTLALATYAYALTGWSLTLALLGYALQYGQAYSAPRRYLADASYWIYLIHLPLVMAMQVAAAQIAAPWWLEYPLMVVLAMGLMLLSYRLWVRGSWIGAMLNGRRLPPTSVP